MTDVTATPFDRIARAQRVVPVLTIGDPDILPPVIDALVRGGIRCLEVTLRTADATDHIRWIRTHHPALWVGAGTVLGAAQWDAAATAGAQFIVSPCATPALLQQARSSPLPWLPGAQTPSEIAALLESGYRTIKFFPAESAGGATALASLAPVFPAARFCPTGGVDAGNFEQYLALSAVSWVAGSWLTPAALVATARWPDIEARTRETLTAVAQATDLSTHGHPADD